MHCEAFFYELVSQEASTAPLNTEIISGAYFHLLKESIQNKLHNVAYSLAIVCTEGNYNNFLLH